MQFSGKKKAEEIDDNKSDISQSVSLSAFNFNMHAGSSKLGRFANLSNLPKKQDGKVPQLQTKLTVKSRMVMNSRPSIKDKILYGIVVLEDDYEDIDDGGSVSNNSIRSYMIDIKSPLLIGKNKRELRRKKTTFIETHWDKTSFDRNNKYKLYLEFVILIFSLYSTFSAAYYASTNLPSSTFYIALDWLIEFVFLVDLVLNFF